MSIFQSVAVSLVSVLTTLGAGWLITTRITDHWDQIKKNRELNLTAARDFQRLYGEAIAIWKIWNAMKSSHPAAFDPPENAKWDCLLRATAMEGEVESLLAKVAAERVLTDDDLAMLGALRQAFKSLRRAIREDQPVPWWSDNVKQYATFKSLAAAMSVLLASKTPTKNRPDAQSAARAFREITANHHETEWIDAVPSLPR